MKLEIAPLCEAMGAVVSGWNPDEDLDAASFALIKQGLRRHLLLIFRGQTSPSEISLIRFAKHFGPLGTATRFFSIDAEHPELIPVLNDPGAADGVAGGGARELPWHTDYVFQEQIGAVSFLEALEIPASGGGVTSFCDTYAALETLDPALRLRLAEFRAYHKVHAYDIDPALAKQATGSESALPDGTHPVVMRNPETGRDSLYVAPDTTRYILELPRDESDSLLAQLFDHTIRQDFVYHHRWQVGDIVVSDQIGTLHRREAFEASERRHMRQITALVPVV